MNELENTGERWESILGNLEFRFGIRGRASPKMRNKND